jgi:hypothetical protein
MTTNKKWDAFLKSPASEMKPNEVAYMEMRCKQAAAGFVRGWNKESPEFFLGVASFLREEARDRQAAQDQKQQEKKEPKSDVWGGA